jgi:GNAT superfamily N-acetyltransferase
MGATIVRFTPARERVTPAANRNLTLVAVNGGDDPFTTYPALQEVWPEPYRQEAAYASREDSGTGEIFYIMLAGEVVGITGVFIDNDVAPDDLFLRWTGVTRTVRQKGVGRAAIQLLARLCQQQYSARKRLIELVPDNAYGHALPKPFFEKIGFAPCNLNVPSGEDELWPVLVYAGDVCALARGGEAPVPYRAPAGVTPHQYDDLTSEQLEAIRRIAAEQLEEVDTSYIAPF